MKQSIKQAAKRGDTATAKLLAKEIVRSRKAVSRLHTSKAQMNSVVMQMQNQMGALPVPPHSRKPPRTRPQLHLRRLRGSSVRCTRLSARPNGQWETRTAPSLRRAWHCGLWRLTRLPCRGVVAERMLRRRQWRQ